MLIGFCFLFEQKIEKAKSKDCVQRFEWTKQARTVEWKMSLFDLP